MPAKREKMSDAFIASLNTYQSKSSMICLRPNLVERKNVHKALCCAKLLALAGFL